MPGFRDVVQCADSSVDCRGYGVGGKGLVFPKCPAGCTIGLMTNGRRVRGRFVRADEGWRVR